MKKSTYLIVICLFISSYCLGQSSNHFVLQWNTNLNSPGVNNVTVTIKTDPNFSYDYKVDWDGDGNFDQFSITGDVTHTYAQPGIYTVRIDGVFPAIYNYLNPDASKLSEILQWGTQQWLTMEQAFHGCVNLTAQTTDKPDLSMVTTTLCMFCDCFLFNDDINNWNMSNVTDMTAMFQNATSFNQPLSNWNVGNVTLMNYTFVNAESFNQNINSWDVSNVGSYFRMFDGATAFNSPLGDWEITNAFDISYMFQDAISFNQDINQWDLNGVTYLLGVFRRASSYNQDMSLWDMSTAITTDGMFELATSFDQDLSSWDMSNVQQFTDIFEDISLSTDNYDAVLSWDMSSINVGSTFGGGNSQYCLSQAARSTIMETYNITFNDGGKDPNSDCDIELDLKASLQGAFNNNNGFMTKGLSVSATLPLIEPYTALNYNHIFGGGETASFLVIFGDDGNNNAIVDWIFVELRDGNDRAKILQTRSGLIQQDGDIVDVDGTSHLSFYNPILATDKLFITIRHRNHLGLSNLIPVNLDPIVTLSLSDSNTLLYGGQDAGVNLGAIINLRAGDANADGTVNSIDKNLHWRAENGSTYNYDISKADFNLDATVNSIDKNNYWRLNNGRTQFLD